MLKKIMLAMAALAVSAAFLGAGSASAATLYKTTAKTTLVPVGTTFTATLPFWNGKEAPTFEQMWAFRNEETGLGACMNSSITFKVTQNSGGTFKAVPTAANFSTSPAFCTPFVIWLNEGTQELSVTGSSTVNGTETAWLGTKFSFNWLENGSWVRSGGFTGATGSPPSKGVFVQQPTAAKAPISLNLVKAPMSKESTYNLTAKFVFTGEAAAWSFG
ncbi:MAG TPA: hypothetical protein VLL27_11765 [Solirubrobacterales bacterium]|nr:hypothetical protein [Solirubrobacterales bacterium]